MSWAEIKRAYAELADAVRDGRPLGQPWRAFSDAARRSRGSPPYHLVELLEALDGQRAGSAPAALRILDHGCGGGSTLLYLLALGYTGIHGVDLADSDCPKWNRLLAETFGIPEPRFFTYDGRHLPLGDASVDVVFSQEVVEHVRPEVLDAYYAEELRVLKPGGQALHQVPHRLTPYEAHTRTWFAHYLPRPLWLAVLRRLGHDMTVPEGALFLRWPWQHRREIRNAFGNCEDLTLSRLRRFKSFEYYDGPVRLRRLIGHALRLPVLGPMVGAVLRNLVMMGTRSRKRQ